MIDMESSYMRLNAQDNVLVCLKQTGMGAQIEDIKTTSVIPAGHKVATRPIASGEAVRKFGQIIGYATRAIRAGEHVHDHNISMGAHDRHYEIGSEANWSPPTLDGLPTEFSGYRRANGRAGTRNYIAIVTSVNCSASVASFIARAVAEKAVLRDYPNIDGIVAFTHGSGCGMAGSGEGFELLRRTIWGHAVHPNVGGVLLLGLGCEVVQLPKLMEQYGTGESDLFRTLTIQGSGGTAATVEKALAIIQEMAPKVNAQVREPVSVSHLTLGMQCGGSDGYSGITANPALGFASDLLVAAGAATILSETPEIYGAEHLLLRRAQSPAIGSALLERIKWWEDYTARLGGDMNNNPSPGNKAGGLSTILEKSLGAAIKGGSAPLAGVYHYAEPISQRGFVFMDSPGYDPCSATGQVASGANMIAFTTGRGSAFGYRLVPSIKLATNSSLFQNMEGDMDINCGDIVHGVSIEAKGREIYRLLVDTASGLKSKSEQLGYGDREFVPWQIGAVM
jgi:altronate hydrolase